MRRGEKTEFQRDLTSSRRLYEVMAEKTGVEGGGRCVWKVASIPREITKRVGGWILGRGRKLGLSGVASEMGYRRTTGMEIGGCARVYVHAQRARGEGKDRGGRLGKEDRK